MKPNRLVMLLIACLLFIGPTPTEKANDDLSTELLRLAQLGITHRYLDDSTIELRDTILGYTRLRTLREPGETTIRTWAALRGPSDRLGRAGIPVIDIDPTQVDTSRWTGWYIYWTYVLVGNNVRIPTQVRDFDGNGYPEMYGLFGGIGFPGTRVFKVYPDGSSAQRLTYPQAGISTHILDVDHNGLWEVVIQRLGINYFYEQPTHTSLPTQLKCAFNKYNGLAAYLSIEPMADMDGDSVMDFVHRGADTTISQHYLACVSEYDSLTQNFRRTWCVETIGDGFNVGDYDGDGRMEFVESGLFGQMRVVENVGDNTYAPIFQDTLPLVNMFHQTSGDIDRDGKREFFVGATMGSGNWTVID